MLNGERPSECGYCWKVEDNSDSFSDRVFKSEEEWSKPFFKEITELDWREDYLPKYVEVSFSNTCNLKCGYCGPSYSSKWVEEMRKHGEFSTGDGFNSLEQLEKDDKLPIPQREHNPYVESILEMVGQNYIKVWILSELQEENHYFQKIHLKY